MEDSNTSLTVSRCGEDFGSDGSADWVPPRGRRGGGEGPGGPQWGRGGLHQGPGPAEGCTRLLPRQQPQLSGAVSRAGAF